MSSAAPMNARPSDNMDRQTEVKIEQLLASMTLEEKFHQLPTFHANGNMRLGIPHMESGEALHGVCRDGATQFPQAIGLGATWDVDLIQRMGCIIGKEARALGMHLCFSPMLGLARDPRWGRIEESYGEDPYHVSQIAVAYVQGIQGTGDERFDADHMMCCAKHFVADGDSWRGSNGETVEICEGTLRETHMVPFEAVVKEVHIGAIMPAHHTLNRVPCHANKWLLSDVLRGEWQFDGMVVSDMLDICRTYFLDELSGHYIARSHVEAGRMALEAGVDAELSCQSWSNPLRTYGLHMLQEVKAGKIPVELIDRAVRNVLRAKFCLGLFGNPVRRDQDAGRLLDKASTLSVQPDVHDPWAKAVLEGRPILGAPEIREDCRHVLEDPQHVAVTLEAAQKAIVLLKNQDDLLPLDYSRLHRIAVIGPNADTHVAGGYSGNPRYAATMLQGIHRLVGERIEVGYAKGCTLIPSPR